MIESIFAGFGGQGVLTAGLILAYTAMENDRNTSWLPSYGAAMRGGKANSTVKFGEDTEEIIGVPMMAEADVLVAMNRPSLDYLQFCKDGAFVFVNQDALGGDYKFPANVTPILIPAGQLAYSVDNAKGVSIVMLGALIKKTGYFSADETKVAMCHMFAEKGKSKMDTVNMAAFDVGYNFFN